MSPQTLSGKFYSWIDKNWSNSRRFFHSEGKATLFSIIFLLIYFLIQIWDFGTTTLMSAVGLERIFMHSRYRKQYYDTKDIKNTYNEMKKENEKLRSMIVNILKILSKRKHKNFYISEIQEIVSGKKKEAKGDIYD